VVARVEDNQCSVHASEGKAAAPGAPLVSCSEGERGDWLCLKSLESGYQHIFRLLPRGDCPWPERRVSGLSDTLDGHDKRLCHDCSIAPVAEAFFGGMTKVMLVERVESSRNGSEFTGGGRQCWGLVVKCYELRTRQHRILNIKALRPSKHYFPLDIMNFGRRL
jgi:hypothetical protein